MGFYGKIYEQVVNIFDRLKFKNTQDTAFPEQLRPDDFILRADGGQDAVIFQAGNKWIQFVENPTAHLQCDVYHAQSNYDAQTTPIFATNKDNDIALDGITSIDHGTVITVKYPTTDEAGHIIGYGEKVYKLQSDLTELWNFVNDLKNAYDNHAQESNQMFILMGENITNANNTANNASNTANNASNTANNANNTANNAYNIANGIKDTADSAAADASNALNKATGVEDALGSGFDITNTVASNIDSLKDTIGDDFNDMSISAAFKNLDAQQIGFNAWMQLVNNWIKTQDPEWTV